jgi:serine/threonine-protein kinase HipA
MSLVTARVLKKGVWAAVLSSDAGEVTFRYREEYLQSERPPISSTLPKTPDEVRLTRGATPAFFSGLLPEGRRLLAVASRLKTSVDNEVTLLLDIGNDLIGDVQVLPESGVPQRKPLQLPRSTDDWNFQAIREDVFGSAASGLPGVQDKTSAEMQNAPVKFAGKQYILKLTPSNVPGVVENEYFFLRLARAWGLRVANHHLLTDRAGEKGLLIERFDRPGAHPESWLAVEDGAQALGVYPAAKYEVPMEEVGRALVGLCKAPAVAAYELFRQVVFSYMMGNGDHHAKNLAVLEDDMGGFHISPAYDLVNTMFYADRTTALTINGKESNLTRSDMMAFAESLGLPEKASLRGLDGFLRHTSVVGKAGLDFTVLPYHRRLQLDVAYRLRKRWEKLQP